MTSRPHTQESIELEHAKPRTSVLMPLLLVKPVMPLLVFSPSVSIRCLAFPCSHCIDTRSWLVSQVLFASSDQKRVTTMLGCCVYGDVDRHLRHVLYLASLSLICKAIPRCIYI